MATSLLGLSCRVSGLDVTAPSFCPSTSAESDRRPRVTLSLPVWQVLFQKKIRAEGRGGRGEFNFNSMKVQSREQCPLPSPV